MPRKLEDLTGQTFGKLEVLKYAGLIPTGKQRQSAWLCRCKCGKEVVIRHSGLKSNGTKSCGCHQKQRAFEANIKDLTGQKFQMLTVLRYAETRNGNAYWLCECECGNKKSISTSCLKSGQKSCGCKQGWFRSEQPGLWKNAAAYSRWKRKDPVRKLRHAVSCSIRGMLKHNGSYKRKKSIRNYLPYSIEELKAHLESLWEPWMDWDNYGGRSNDKRRTWHIDHIIPHYSFKYTSMADSQFLECWALSNLRPLEKKLNMSKGPN